MGRARAEFLTGGTLGLLVGALLGLSSSPVVGSVLAALTALLATFMGLATDSASPERSRRWLPSASALRITSFSLLALVGVAGGVYVRTHDAFSPDLEAQAAAWRRIGFDEARAKDLVAYRVLGVVPAGWAVAAPPVEAAKDTGRSVLFSVSAEDCGRLRPARYDSAELANAFSIAGGRWSGLASAVKPLSAAQQGEVLTAAWRLACE